MKLENTPLPERIIECVDFVTLDFETATNQDAHACAIGLSWVKNGEVVHTSHSLIRPPGNRYDIGTIRVHKINGSITENQPEFPVIWEKIYKHIENLKIYAHFASFDEGVLRRCLSTYDIKYPRLDFHCSLALSRMAWPEFSSHKLGDLCRSLGISLTHHHAGSDAEATARLVVLAKRRLAGESIAPKHWSNRVRIAPGALRGHCIVVTGEVASLTREEAREACIAAGAEWGGWITKRTTLLVVGNAFGNTKYDRAVEYRQKYGRPQFISSEQFMAALAGEGLGDGSD